MAGGGISGVAVALATAGGVLLYAGFQGLDPVQALKDITSGKTKVLEPSQTSFVNDPTGIGQGGGVIQADWDGGGSGFGGALVDAMMSHRGERYSGARRWEKGFSDCSSIVGKSLKDIGITPPSGSTTWSYLAWKKLKTVPKSQIQTGDLLISGGHMAVAIDGTRAIGMQNARSNVRVDSIEAVMWGAPGWIARRYTGAAPKSKSGSERTAQA